MTAAHLGRAACMPPHPDHAGDQRLCRLDGQRRSHALWGSIGHIEPDSVCPGGTVAITTVRRFLADCDVEFERRLESVDDRRAAAVILPDERMRTPWKVDGKPRTMRIAIPSDFPCGAAQIRTAPAASCNWMQVAWLRQHQRAVITPFEASCMTSK